MENDNLTWKGIAGLAKLCLVICGVLYLLEAWHNRGKTIRDEIGTVTVNVKDSAYVLTTKLDSVYYEAEEIEGGETQSRP